MKEMIIVKVDPQSYEADLLFAYCLAKGKLWQKLFGLRHSRNGRNFYKINRKDFEHLQAYAQCSMRDIYNN